MISTQCSQTPHYEFLTVEKNLTNTTNPWIQWNVNETIWNCFYTRNRLLQISFRQQTTFTPHTVDNKQLWRLFQSNRFVWYANLCTCTQKGMDEHVCHIVISTNGMWIYNSSFPKTSVELVETIPHWQWYKLGQYQPPTKKQIEPENDDLLKRNLHFHVCFLKMMVSLSLSIYAFIVKYLIFLYYLLMFLAEGLNHKFVLRFAKKRTCPSNARWSWLWDAPEESETSQTWLPFTGLSGSISEVSPLKVMVSPLKVMVSPLKVMVCLPARQKLGFLEDIWWRTSWTESLGLVVVSQFWGLLWGVDEWHSCGYMYTYGHADNVCIIYIIYIYIYIIYLYI